MFDTDIDLITGLKANDPAAYEKLIELYADMVYRVAFRMLQNDHDAEDALQETFLAVYRRIESFRGEAKFSSWLYRVATNVTLDIIRAKQRKHLNQTAFDVPGDGEEIEEPADTFSPLPEEVLMQKEAVAELQRGVGQLSPKLRSAFVLFELEGLSIKETAAVLEISESAAKLRVHRARIALQKWMVEQTREAQK